MPNYFGLLLALSSLQRPALLLILCYFASNRQRERRSQSNCQTIIARICRYKFYRNFSKHSHKSTHPVFSVFSVFFGYTCMQHPELLSNLFLTWRSLYSTKSRIALAAVQFERRFIFGRRNLYLNSVNLNFEVSDKLMKV